MNRQDKSRLKYGELFGGQPTPEKETDPELMEILRRYIFCDVFSTGKLDNRTREMITCECLAAMQTLPQLKAHAASALNVGVTPVELREMMYQLAPFIGFPKTLNAVVAVNEVFAAKGISVPLENQATLAGDGERFAKGYAIQNPLYGEEIKQQMKGVPYGDSIANFLTEFCFGDIFSRNGLSIQLRELLSLCILAAIGADDRIKSHSLANIKAGNDAAMQIEAMIQCLPYIGFPAALKAVKIIHND